MEWIAIAKIILEEAPPVINAVGEGLEWALKTWNQVKEETGKDETTITPDDLRAHLRHMGRSSNLIQNLK